MNILLTGGQGFVGKRLIDELRNHDIKFIHQRDWEEVSNIPELVEWCDVVAHIGAIADTMDYDVNYMMRNNWLYSKDLFDMAQEEGKKVVFASTAAIYGNDKNYLNPYAWSKHVTESYGLVKVDDFISLRYFNVYGPGESHKGKMASMAYQAMLKNRTGETVSLFEGKPTRDFIYIDDIIQATKQAILEKHARGIYDVGTSESRSFEDVMNGLNIPFNYINKEKPKHYQMFTCAKEKNWLKNWEPKYTLEQGLNEYQQWFTDHEAS